MFDTTALGDGPWRPVPMRGPKVLYRSVSVPELLDICRSGTIRGGMNRFNPADRRPLVFFADTLDDRLISQGEHIHRQAYYAAESSQEHLLCEFLRQRIREHGTLILGHLHVMPGMDPMKSVLQREPMIPLTSATIAYSVAGAIVARDVGTVIVNRLQVDWITATAEEASIFPDATVRSPYTMNLRKDFTGPASL